MSVNNLSLSTKGRKFIQSFEGLILYAYDDKMPSVHGVVPEWNGGPLKGTATIGYGHTNVARYPLKVVPGLRITAELADTIFASDIGEVVDDVNRAVLVPITQGEADALYSFTFNCGIGNLRKLIENRLNKYLYPETRDALALYVTSGGEKMAGLVRRRAGEQALWDGKDAETPDKPVDHPAEVYPVPTPRPPVATPPAPRPRPAPVPPGPTPTQVGIGAGIGAALIALAAFGQQVVAWISNLFGM